MTPALYMLDDDNNPVLVDVEGVEGLDKWLAWRIRWARKNGNDGQLHVAYTELPDGVLVSTIFLGINPTPWRSSPPLLWETMVFVNGKPNGKQFRYSSHQLAVEGHDAVVKAVMKGGTDDASAWTC